MEKSVLHQPSPLPGTGDGEMAFSLNCKTVSGMRMANAKNVTYDDSMKPMSLIGLWTIWMPKFLLTNLMKFC